MSLSFLQISESNLTEQLKARIKLIIYINTSILAFSDYSLERILFSVKISKEDQSFALTRILMMMIKYHEQECCELAYLVKG